MDENILWWRGKILEKTAQALIKNQFEVFVEYSNEDVVKRVLTLIPADASVGIGGSMSVRELKLIERLTERSQKLIYHTPAMSKEEANKKRIEAMSSDIYLASPQAISIDGKVVFLDSNANRTAAVSFGPKGVLLIAGFNKITFDEQSAIFRAKNIAAPINAKRLNLNTPCAQTGFCANCDSPQRICRVLEVFYKRPISTPVTIVLSAQELGY